MNNKNYFIPINQWEIINFLFILFIYYIFIIYNILLYLLYTKKAQYIYNNAT